MDNILGVGIFRRRRSSASVSPTATSAPSAPPGLPNSTTANPSLASTHAPSSSTSTTAKSSRSGWAKSEPYEVPPADGTCHFLRLPGEVLGNVFMRLDRPELMRCFRLCKATNEYLTGSAELNLHLTLMCNSLRLNPLVLTAPSSAPLVMPRTSAELLSTLRERLTRFRNFRPKGDRVRVYFNEPEGRLYEYLEGILLRGIGSRFATPQKLAVYDLRRLNEWEDTGEVVQPGEESGEGEEGEEVGEGMEDVEEGEEEEDGGEDDDDWLDASDDGIDVDEEDVEGQGHIRTRHDFGFSITDFAVDPGQDLLVIVEIRGFTNAGRTSHAMHFHLLELSTFKPHPRAKKPLLIWPMALQHNRAHLGFQICDDGLYVLHNNNHGGTVDQLCGWQWTTGRLHVVLRAVPIMTFESFVLLTPTSFAVPSITTRIDPNSLVQDQLNNADDLSWDHHINLYAFPPFTSTPALVAEAPNGQTPPPFQATHVATIDLPDFLVDLERDIPPPRLSIRTDPPPRTEFPTHPAAPGPGPAPFQPDPETGLIVMEVACQMNEVARDDPHFVICILKQSLIPYLPPPTSPLLRQPFHRPVPVIPWATIAPKARLFGPDLLPPKWVCYVYHHYWIYCWPDVLLLYDFDPMRTRKEILDRQHSSTTSWKQASPGSPSAPSMGGMVGTDTSVDGDRDGITLVVAETVTPKKEPLMAEIKTGSELPYTVTTIPTPSHSDVALIDAERIVLVNMGYEDSATRQSRIGHFQVMQF